MIYLDNGATTNKKPNSVILAMLDGITKYSANPGRSGHALSLEVAEKIMETRQNIADFFGCPSVENVIFTSGCTEALNLAILGYAKAGGHVIATVFDHNSTLRPLFYLKEQGIIELDVISPKNPEKITLDDIKNAVKPNTYMVVNTHISNVDGAETDVDQIGNFCHQNNILYLVDAAQSAGHKQINMQKSHINLLAIAGHKGLFASQGVGALLINSKTLPKPIKFGGTGTDSISVIQPTEPPECFESGTIATPNILSLNEGINFCRKNLQKIQNKIEFLTNHLLKELSYIKDLKIYTSKNNPNGVIAFNISNIDSSDISSYLNEKHKIFVRSGLHCAPLKHKFLGTENQGIVRVSISYFNTKNELNTLIRALKTYTNNLNI